VRPSSPGGKLETDSEEGYGEGGGLYKDGSVGERINIEAQGK